MSENKLEENKEDLKTYFLDFIKSPSSTFVFVIFLNILNYKFWIIVFSGNHIFEKIFWIKHYVTFCGFLWNILYASLFAIFYPFLIWCLKLISEKANYIVSKETYIEQNKTLKKEKKEREAELKTIDESLKGLSGEKRVEKIKTLEGKITEARKMRDEYIATIETEKEKLFTSNNKFLHENSEIRYYLLKEDTLDVKAVLNIGRGITFYQNENCEKAIERILKTRTNVTLTQFLFITLDESIFKDTFFSRIYSDSKLDSSASNRSNSYNNAYVNVVKISKLSNDKIKEYFAEEIRFFAIEIMHFNFRNTDIIKDIKSKVSSSYNHINNIMLNENASEKDIFSPFDAIMFFVNQAGGYNKAGQLVIEYIEKYLKEAQKTKP
jgi:hypothetical protein